MLRRGWHISLWNPLAFFQYSGIECPTLSSNWLHMGVRGPQGPLHTPTSLKGKIKKQPTYKTNNQSKKNKAKTNILVAALIAGSLMRAFSSQRES